MTSSRLRQPAPRTSLPSQPSTNDYNSSWSAVPPNTPVVYGSLRGKSERGRAGRDEEAAQAQTNRPRDDDRARRIKEQRVRADPEQPGMQSPRLFLAPPNTPSDTRPRASQLPRRAQPHQSSRSLVVRSGSIHKRTSVRRPGGPPRAGGFNVGQVGSSTHSRSRIPEPPLPLTGRERLRPTSYHAPSDASRRARGPILEPPTAYHSRDRPVHGSSSNLPRRRPSLRYRSAGPRAATTPHSSPRLPSSSLAKRPPLPHLSSSESLLRVKMPTSRPTALGLTHRPRGRDRAPRMEAEHESSASSLGPDEAKLLWAELERRLAPEDVGPNNYDDDLEDGWSKEWVRDRERQRDHGAGVSLASLALDEARRIASSDEDRDTFLRPPSYPSGGSYETAAQWSPLATVGSPRASPLHRPSGSLSPLPPHSPCPQMAHPSPRALPGLRSPLLDPTYTCPSPIGMQRLDSHVAKTMRGLEEVWTGGGSPLMLGRPLAGLWDEDEVEDGKETTEEEDGNERELARRLIWNESYRRTGRWRASVSAMAGVTKEENTTSEGIERDLSAAVPELESEEVKDVADKEVDLDLDVKFIGLRLVDEDTTTALVPSLGFGSNPNPRSRLSTLTNSNSEESSSASSSRTNSSLGVPPAISTRSSSLTSSASTSSSADRIKSPLLPVCAEIASPHIPESPLLSLPTPDLSLAPASPSPGGLRPLSLPIKYNLAPASPVVAEFGTRRVSLGSVTGVGSRRVSGGGAANRRWRVMGGEMGEGEGAEVRMWK